ncbi:NAD(P)/FAD-dependent oxidoreductase [Baekduia soli]|uniref:Pyridine nucleotide-disulfide oxidoreductase domain-containing protein 2 n=1 Tax=Baekduia soli TaxID=496014 RepID=A0A5B8U5J0_9ACTN|nr:NAD(P)/FAD-dependent oxidoreductase [Baekduia soli]QEC48290.1 NAD(P)/FAD-dependent oxidoreductase [Baekduia soli]
MLTPVTRVVVIGAGHNGLVAAVHLAAGGLSPLVLEQAPRPGGATRSAARTLPGFVHDDHAAFVPMAVASPAMRELRLEDDGLRWVTPSMVMAHPFEDGTAIALHRDVGATAASLGGRAGSGWERAMGQLLPHATTLVETILAPLPPVAGPLRLGGALRRDGLDWARRMLGSIEALGLEIFAGDRRATAWLSGSAQHSGLPPSTAGSGAFGLVLQVLGHSHGWPVPVGGMGSLVDALLARGAREGSRVRCDARVERIITRGGRLTGVRLVSGEEIAADAVISTLSAGPLVGMLEPGALPARLERRLRSWRYGTGAFKLDYALSGPVPWTAAEPREAAVVHVAGALGALEAAAQDGTHGEVPERPALVVGQQSLVDPSRAPAGHHTLYVYAHVPSRYAMGDEDVAARIEAQLERFAPGFAAAVLGRSLRAPHQTEVENPSMVGGDLGGGTMELDQQLVFRPAPELVRYRTPLKGLYVAGASIHPGGAVHGMSGRGAARALLHDRRLRPWRTRAG